MDYWQKAPIVFGTFELIGAHFFDPDLFGLGAVTSLIGLLCLSDLVGPERIKDAVLKERERCRVAAEVQANKQRRYDRGEISFGELCDPYSL